MEKVGNPSLTGMVFNIERYAVEDGPGIRTLVFLKGCPLRCEWCANPESQLYQPQVMYYSNRCAGCGRCVEQCPQQAIRKDEVFGLVIDADLCTVCGICVDVCFYGAREISGKEMTVAEVMDVVNRDKLFYEKSGGGVTISGGEPLLQSAFVSELTQVCKQNNIHTAIETSLFADKNIVVNTLKDIDLVFVDIKHTDSQVHKQRTGVSNERILQNILLLDELGKSLIIRIPYIPGFNDDMQTQKEIYRWVSQLKNCLWVEILPYHRLATTKYSGLGRSYQLQHLDPVKKQDIQYLIAAGAEIGVQVRIGAK